MNIKEMRQTDGGADFFLVELSDDGNVGKLTPHCKRHRAMNRVSPFREGEAIWRCLQFGCRAGCIQAVGK